jgi:hypothetical protein
VLKDSRIGTIQYNFRRLLPGNDSLHFVLLPPPICTLVLIISVIESEKSLSGFFPFFHQQRVTAAFPPHTEQQKSVQSLAKQVPEPGPPNMPLHYAPGTQIARPY